MSGKNFKNHEIWLKICLKAVSTFNRHHFVKKGDRQVYTNTNLFITNIQIKEKQAGLITS